MSLLVNDDRSAARRRVRGGARLLGAAALTAVCAVAVVPASPAAARPPWSQILCDQHEPANNAAWLTIVNGRPTGYGVRGTLFGRTIIGPGEPVRDGDVVRIRASGSMKIDSWPWGPSYSPAGDPLQTLTTSSGNRSLPKYSLYGFFPTTGQTFGVRSQNGGIESDCITYHGPETSLLLAQNDDNLGDNSGTWNIEINHYSYH